MAANDKSSYEVGFGKPPKHHQFQKGTSGNASGRPKGRRNLATVLEQTLQEKVVINESGIRTTVTKLEAAVKQLVNKAASGDLVALRQLTALARSAEDQAVDSPSEKLSDSDSKVMQNVLKRMKGCAKGDSDVSE